VAADVALPTFPAIGAQREREAPTALESYAGREVPPLGGWNLTFLWIEIRRLLRNRRTVVATAW
jgi:hypothetical protein